jgi:hypothetical protein
VFTGFRLGGMKVRDHWEDLGVGGRITLRWTIGRLGLMGQTGYSLVVGFCEHGDKPLGSIKIASYCLTS